MAGWRSRVDPYWAVDFCPRPVTLEDAKDELDSLLKSAVRASGVRRAAGRLVERRPGSSTVLHYASEALGSKLKTFGLVQWPGVR